MADFPEGNDDPYRIGGCRQHQACAYHEHSIPLLDEETIRGSQRAYERGTYQRSDNQHHKQYQRRRYHRHDMPQTSMCYLRSTHVLLRLWIFSHRCHASLLDMLDKSAFYLFLLTAQAMLVSGPSAWVKKL